MLSNDGEKQLKTFHDETYQKEVYEINERITYYCGYGHSNCIVIEGNHSLVMIDALDSTTRAERLKNVLSEKTKKPVKTIIFTHGHPDHRGGSGSFKDVVEETIMFAPETTPIIGYDELGDILGKRTARQFGRGLTNEECICQGLGIREGIYVNDGSYDFLPITTLYTENITREIDGIQMELVRVPGETDDQMLIWLPDDGVLCCGDNFYGCFPNLYALRGSQYRDVIKWINSLDQLLSYPAKVLLPGHMKPIFTQEKIQETLSNYKEALSFILHETLRCMNQGMSVSETVEHVVLPQHLSSLPYLQEFYGSLEWAVKGIYNGYVGWFDGNPVNLHPLSDAKWASKLIHLISEDTLRNEIQLAMQQQEYQYALQLCALFDQTKSSDDTIISWEIDCMLALSKLETSACGRNYYIASANDLKNQSK